MKLLKNIFFIVALSIMYSVSAKVMQKSPKAPTTPIVLSSSKKNVTSTLTTPITKEETKTYYGMATAQNKRDYQEDRFTHALINAKNEGEFFAIYDGHGGDKVSSHLQKNLHLYFTECLTRKTTIKEAFECAFLKAENYALQHFNDGSTVVAVYIDKNNILHLAWVGDSRAVLEKNGTVDLAVKDHKPNRPDELNRIGLAGGKILKHGVWRINGLAISRSIGDRRSKKVN